MTSKNPEPDPLGEAYDIDALGEFLKTWEVQEKEVLRSKTILTSRTFSEVPGEIHVNDEIDEELAMKKETGETKAAILEPKAHGIAGHGSQADKRCNSIGYGAWILRFEFGEEVDQGTSQAGAMLHVARN